MARERILVADDEPDVLDVAVRALTREGYRVTGIASGSAAVEEARLQHYDLLVADVKMPGISGLRAYKLIKAFSPDTICLIITGYGTLEMAIEAVRLGVHAFILKPFGPSELCAAVGRALEGRRLAQENARLRALLPVHELTRALVATTDLDRLVQQVVDLATRETGATSCALWLLDKAHQDLYLAGNCSDDGAGSSGVRCQIGQGIVGSVVQSGEPMAIDGALNADGLSVRANSSGSSLCLPLQVKDEIIGVLSLYKATGEPLTAAENELLSILADGAAVAIENASLFTSLQRAYERLAELDHRKSEFISLAAHELRSPLAAIITYATLMEENPGESTDDHLRTILEAAARLQVLIDNMLSLRNLEIGREVLRPEAVRLADAATQALERLAHLARAKSQVVQVDLPGDLPPVSADPPKLQIILLNLLSNAIKFTPPGGHITICATPVGNEALVSVSDTGIGIPPAAHERIFERFYQVADSLRREQAGLGLGLPITKGMVELHGGRIWVESEEGQGSTFRFTLPLCQMNMTGVASQ